LVEEGKTQTAPQKNKTKEVSPYLERRGTPKREYLTLHDPKRGRVLCPLKRKIKEKRDFFSIKKKEKKERGKDSPVN